MANQEHLDILRQGAKAWNAWREEHPEVQPDLSGADFSDANLNSAYLSGTNLSDADLSGTDLWSTNLSNANLTHTCLWSANLSDTNLSGANFSSVDLSDTGLMYANLSGADLSSTNLIGADLRHAILHEADLCNAKLSDTDLRFTDLSDTNLRNADFSLARLSYANLSGANLSEANLRHANLNRTNLSMTNMSEAIFDSTQLDDLDLRAVKGLETVKHYGPSTIGIDTILRSEGDIPEIFLRGVGLDDTFISYVLALAKKPIQFYSCFISYSSKDQEFAERLYADLQANNVRCWYAPEDLKIGDKIRPCIDESIHLYDRLLLVLSRHSVASQWVEQEVETALEKERKEQRTVLFPICLDNAVMDIKGGWPALIRNTRNIGDFTHWKEHDQYQKGLTRLLRDLKQEAIKDTTEDDAHKDQKQSTSRERQS